MNPEKPRRESKVTWKDEQKPYNKGRSVDEADLQEIQESPIEDDHQILQECLVIQLATESELEVVPRLRDEEAIITDQVGCEVLRELVLQACEALPEEDQDGGVEEVEEEVPNLRENDQGAAHQSLWRRRLTKKRLNQLIAMNDCDEGLFTVAENHAAAANIAPGSTDAAPGIPALDMGLHSSSRSLHRASVSASKPQPSQFFACAPSAQTLNTKTPRESPQQPFFAAAASRGSIGK
jgi:hypothetical protein